MVKFVLFLEVTKEEEKLITKVGENFKVSVLTQAVLLLARDGVRFDRLVTQLRKVVEDPKQIAVELDSLIKVGLIQKRYHNLE